MAPDVISSIVKNDLCIGCGACATICPDQSLEMRFNRFGEYNPVKEKECVKECGLCLKVCPFADGNDNEDSIGKALYGTIPGISYRPETGYYSDCFVGFAPDTRERGSSGGMATWLLSTLLKKGIVDYVIAVVPDDDPDKLFRFCLLYDSESVLHSSGSAYYPVELSGVLTEIQNNPGRCAIIGLPCFIKAVRLATQKNKKLRERIITTVGLVCGQLKSRQYTEYLSALCGVTSPLENVHYRGKSPKKPASNYFFSCTGKGGEKGKIFWDDGVAEAWTNRWFTPNACNYCDDVFAECADVTFMDAWLPEYWGDYRGTSVVLVRSVQLQNIIVDGSKAGEIKTSSIPIQKVTDSQKGGITEKKITLAYRLFLNRSAGFVSPQKRIQPVRFTNPFQKKKIVIKDQMCKISKNIWAEHHSKGTVSVKDFRDQMSYYLTQLSRWNLIEKIVTLPLFGIRYIRRKIRGCFK